jgi:predicted hotdog family 3-hydroxylacyl-ACP dehydratase
MNLGREWIEAHVPQKDGMCLLDEVLSWDAEQVLCRSGTHRSANHPLRAHAQLGSACAIEYAAQAAALHGALCATGGRGGARLGLLASVRGVELTVARLDTLKGDLLVRVRRIQSDARGALYAFEVSEQLATGPSAPLARGRLSLWLDAALGAGSV